MTKLSRLIILLATLWGVCGRADAGITLDYCLQRAETNYPLIRKYGLVERTAELDLAEINRGWLPRLGLSAQATVQNVVPSFPDAFKGLMGPASATMRGMGHLQYKAVLDVTQTIWDGGASKAQRGVARATAAQNEAAIAVEMYAVRQRVENLFFGILLMDAQMRQTSASIALLESSHGRLVAMVANGVAMQADADMVEAQCLTMRQHLAEARSVAGSYRQLLGIYIGEDPGDAPLELPKADLPVATGQPDRPELNFYDTQLQLTEARRKALDTSVMPRIGFFAQAYYGYPGINYFESMMKRNLSFNALAGVKVSWNIDSFYTRGTSREKLSLSAGMVRADREIFLFNTRLESTRNIAEIDGLRDVMREDTRIVELRENVRRSAEAQLSNGVIDATALLAKITDENQARLTASYHEIQLVQYIYQLKHTLNR